jgi:hypothetical protein
MIKNYQIHCRASTATPFAGARAGSKLSQAEPGRRAIRQNAAKENAWISLDSLVRFEAFQWLAPPSEAKLLFAAAEAAERAAVRPPGVRARAAKQWAHWTYSGLIGDRSTNSDYEKQQSPRRPDLDDTKRWRYA